MFGHPFLEPKNVYVPPSGLDIPHSSYQTTGSTSGFFAELFILWTVSVQSDSLIWLCVARWRNVGETVLVCLVNWKGFHLVEIISHVTSMSVPQPTHAFMYLFYINVSGRAHQNQEGRMLMIYNAVFRHFHIFWGCNIAIMNFIPNLILSSDYFSGALWVMILVMHGFFPTLLILCWLSWAVFCCLQKLEAIVSCSVHYKGSL